MSSTDDRSLAMQAIQHLITNFAKHDKEAYFEAFAEEATFLFHNQSSLLNGKAAYRAEWEKWEQEDGFRVLSCKSTEQHLQLLGNTAIFTHQVETELSFKWGRETSSERETIIMIKGAAGDWLAQHEHLSVRSV